MIHKQGRLRGDKTRYSEADVSCCVWYPMNTGSEDEEAGLCFDFDATDIDDFIVLLQTLKGATPDDPAKRDTVDMRERVERVNP